MAAFPRELMGGPSTEVTNQSLGFMCYVGHLQTLIRKSSATGKKPGAPAAGGNPGESGPKDLGSVLNSVSCYSNLWLCVTGRDPKSRECTEQKTKPNNKHLPPLRAPHKQQVYHQGQSQPTATGVTPTPPLEGWGALGGV